MTGPGANRAGPIEIFDALGIGWGVHELYPDPVRQHAFLSAVERLSVLQDSSITYEIGAGKVTCDGEELSIQRGGTARLSLRLFVHEIEWLELIGAPAAQDLDEFFTLLAADEKVTRTSGGIARALQDREVWSIAVTQRGLLSSALEKPWEEREGEHQQDAGDGGPRAERLARMVTAGATAADVADAMVEEGKGDPLLIAESFGDAYRMIYPGAELGGARTETVPEMLSAYRQAPKARPPVDTFAEAFFLIPVEARARVLSDFLDNRSEGLHSLLLDQFAGLELAELAPHLDEETFQALVGYARDVVDSETGSADELLPMVSAARDVRVARKSAADRIREMIEGIGGLGGATGGLAGKLRKENAKTEELALYVVRMLMDIEERPDRFSRFADAWCRRISRLVEQGDLEHATLLLGAGTGDVELTPQKRRTIQAALVELLRTDYAVFNEAAHDPTRRDALGTLLKAFGEPAVAHLMDRLSVDEDPATRRILISLLAVVGSSYPDPIVRFFGDPKWYVVRNAVTIAGKIGGDRWVPHLQPLLEHPDHRVVIETMRALSPIAPDATVPALVRSLAHPHDRVRETAALLLRASTSPARQAVLTAALTDSAMDGPARSRIAALLYELGTPEALAVLEQLARKPFLISSTRRDARRAARDVLGIAA
jgi:hypothetical protein